MRSKNEHTLEGSIEMAGGEHFYLESHGSIAYPKEDGPNRSTSPLNIPPKFSISSQNIGFKIQPSCLCSKEWESLWGKESQASLFAFICIWLKIKLTSSMPVN